MMFCKSNFCLFVASMACSLFLQTAAAQAVNQLQELGPSDPNEVNSFFGEAVDVYGNTMVVGSASRSGFEFGENKVYVFEQENGVWVEKQILQPDDATEIEYVRLGYEVSIHGNFIAFTGNEVIEREPANFPGDPDRVSVYRGVVFIFEKTEGVWGQTKELTVNHLTNTPNDSGAFGQNISIHGNTLAVAMPYGHIIGDSSYLSNPIFVYEHNGTDWLLSHQIKPASVDDNDYFGKSLDLFGDVLGVGNHTNDGGSDAVHIIERAGGIWQEVTVAIPSGSYFLNRFGDNVSIYGGSMLISAAGDLDNGDHSGAAYEFERIGGTWVETNKLKPGNSGIRRHFGRSLDYNGETAVIGQYAIQPYSLFTQPIVFKRIGATWEEIVTLAPFTADVDYRNGSDVAVRGNTVAVANHYYAPGGGLGNQGRVWIHQLEVATAPETPSGQDVEVIPVVEDINGNPVDSAPEFNFTFEDIDTSGDTTITVVDPDPTTATPPQGFSILGLDDSSALFDFHTTANMAAESTVEICIDYSTMGIAGDPEDLVFAHEVGGVWQDITSSNDLQNGIICGVTDSFSYFALMEVADPVNLLAKLIDDVAALNAKNGIINSLDKKLESAQDALNDARANNDNSAINVLINAFVNHVEAQRGKEISADEADYLVTQASGIVMVIEGGVSL